MLLVASSKDLFLNESGKLHALRAAVPYVPYVPSVPTWSRALCALCCRGSRASCPTCSRAHVSRALPVFCLMCLVPNVFSYLMCLRCSCTSRVLCLAFSWAASNSTCSFAPRPSLAWDVSSLTCSYVSHVLQLSYFVSLVLLLLQLSRFFTVWAKVNHCDRQQQRYTKY